MVLVDTGVWIDLLRNRDTAATTRLRQLLARGLAAVAPVIVQELLQGASSASSLQALREHFVALPMVLPRSVIGTYAAAGELYARCRWLGVTPRSPLDCLIAELAIENELPLLHDDRDFDRIAGVEPKLILMRD